VNFNSSFNYVSLNGLVSTEGLSAINFQD